MEAYKFQLIETAVVLLLLIVGSRVSKRLIEQAGVKFTYHKTRIKIVKKITTIVLYLLVIGILLLVWGIAPSELAAYLASLFTVVGIAFLAQWSIISNITSTLIIFFNHQVNIGDSVVVLDKDYSVSGKISDIGLFFIIIKVETDEYVSIPSNVFMQKMVKKVVK